MAGQISIQEQYLLRSYGSARNGRKLFIICNLTKHKSRSFNSWKEFNELYYPHTNKSGGYKWCFLDLAWWPGWCRGSRLTRPGCAQVATDFGLSEEGASKHPANTEINVKEIGMNISHLYFYLSYVYINIYCCWIIIINILQERRKLVVLFVLN